MNKKSRIILVMAVSIVLVLSMVLAACQNFKWGPVGEISEGDVINNGSVVVEQGGYLYYVNGKDDPATLTDPYQNHFGKATVKGSIMKSKIAEDGSLEDTEVLVPKMYNNANVNNGLWIQGDWLYYTSPSTQTDNKGTVLVDKLEYMRTKLDGTKTQSLAIVQGTSVAYTVTPDALIYAEADKLMRVPFTEKKVKKAEQITDKVTSSLFTQGSNVIFYTKATESTTLNHNNVYVMNGNSEAIEIMNSTTWTQREEPLLQEQKTVSLIKYDPNENVLYYSRKANDAMAATGTYGYKFGEEFTAVQAANEKKYATSAVNNFVVLGYEKGILDVSAAKIFKYNVIADREDVIDNKGEGIELSAAPKILFVENNYLYYTVNDKLMRMAYSEEDGFKFKEESICDETMMTAWFAPVKIGEYIYYFDGSNNYLHRIRYTDYVIKDSVVTKPVGKIVSGYESNDKVEGDEAPKFMTETDKQAWVDAHLKKEDK